MAKNRLLLRCFLFAMTLALAAQSAWCQKPEVLESAHYRIFYQKQNAELAGKVLEIAEQVWPTLARAYDAYKHYQRIDVFLTDYGDDANGFAIYEFSRVEIFVPHINWVMRGRGNWVGNVVTHELAHIFTLRQQAGTSSVDEFDAGIYKYNKKTNYSFNVPWIPRVSPTWWVEGIAQFESTQNGYDLWDSQRDMIVRDGYLTKTLPSLGEIETFDGDWLQAERTYNTGFAFLLYLKERFGVDKVRDLAVPKPLFNFSTSVRKALGKSLEDLFEDWKKSLDEKYARFKEYPLDAPVDPEIRGNYNQNFTLSADGRYQAWLGNDNRDSPMNWIFWKDLQKGESGKSRKPVSTPEAPPTGTPLRQAAEPEQLPVASLPPSAMRPLPFASRGFLGSMPGASPRQALRPRTVTGQAQRLRDKRVCGHFSENRSEEFGAAGLEFNQDNTRLLTTRSNRYSSYNDIWEYEFQATGKSEEERWHQLTWNERASFATYHPTRPNVILFVRLSHGNTNVALLDSVGRVLQLTNFREGQQAYNPRFTPSGDSIYFSLGVDEKEAIVAVPANLPGFDPFQAIRDSAAFPDSMYVARGYRLTFVTPLEKGSVRDLHFAHDTLFWSSSTKEGVFNVYSHLPGDSMTYRATQVQGQALEPQVYNGELYYQGYRQQHFNFYKRPLALAPAYPWKRPMDTLPASRSKKLDYKKAADEGEAGAPRIAWSINPFLVMSPQFLDDTTLSDLSLVTGVSAMIGDLGLNITHSVEGYVSKVVDSHTPMDYGLTYAGYWSQPTIRHQLFSWTPELQYYLHHSLAHQNQKFTVQQTFDAPQLGGTVEVVDRVRYEYLISRDVLGYNLAMPYHNGPLWGGYFIFVAGGQWERRQLDIDIQEDYTATLMPINSVLLDTSLNEPLLRESDAAKMFSQQAIMGWQTYTRGKYLPSSFDIYGSVQKWWTTYGDQALQTDTTLRQNLSSRGRVAPLLVITQKDFQPWQLDVTTGFTLAKGSPKTGSLGISLSTVAQAGSFTEKFPMSNALVDLKAAANPDGSPRLDTTFGEIPPNNLWLMTYRLGLSRMPGYGYNFFYQGQDILQGSAMFWTRTALEIPYLVRQFVGLGTPPSSFNQVRLSLIGDAGTALFKAPTRLVSTLEKGQQKMLFDYGVRVSATMYFYHAYPLTAYFQVFQPYNQLKASDLYLSDYRGPPAPRDPQMSDADYQRYLDGFFAGDEVLRNNYMKAVKDPRFFFGLEIGVF